MNKWIKMFNYKSSKIKDDIKNEDIRQMTSKTRMAAKMSQPFNQRDPYNKAFQPSNPCYISSLYNWQTSLGPKFLLVSLTPFLLFWPSFLHHLICPFFLPSPPCTKLPCPCQDVAHLCLCNLCTKFLLDCGEVSCSDSCERVEIKAVPTILN